MPFRQHTLDNGLQVIAECDPGALSLAVGFFVKTGSRDETAPEAGVSHFLEHMVFKGTRKYSAYELAKRMEALGGHFDAFTTKESK